MQMGQIANSLNQRERGTFGAQPEPNPHANQVHNVQSDQINQANAVITLRSGKQILSSHFPSETQENPSSDSTFKPSTSAPTPPLSPSIPPSSESGPSEEPDNSEKSTPYKPKAPFPHRLASKKQYA